MAAQLTGTKGCWLRVDSAWMARATSSFPVPDSPCTNTVALLGATREMRAVSSRIA